MIRNFVTYKHIFMKRSYSLLLITVLIYCSSKNVSAQNVGIGTTNPLARLHVGDSSVVFTVPTGGIPPLPRNPPVSGAGRRFVWYADKAAIRAGEVNSASWDKDNTGSFSAGFGYNSMAYGGYSLATGYNTSAIGNASTALGDNTISKAFGSIAIGSYNDNTDNPSGALPTDRVFQIGNGNSTTRSNALTVLRNGNIGIGTLFPITNLHVVDKNVLFSNTSTSLPASPADVPISGTGNRMMWYADKAAFRAGGCLSSSWNKDSIGTYSFAGGFDSRATNSSSIALGFNAIARGLYSIAIGSNTIASDYSSVAIGEGTLASGYAATAIGSGTIASGRAATAMGSNTEASGNYSTALGRYVKTNGKTGSFIIGDDGSQRLNNVYYSDVNNQMQMVFAGGYRLYTGSAISGVYMNGGDNSWSAVSDSTKKEKLLPVDGELFLNKISKLRLSSWNYKGQSAKQYRHYGPMAQDFHNAFGKDAYGNIGCDTLINQQDFLGINLIAIQALEKRTTKIEMLQKQNAALQQQLDEVQQNNLVLQQQMKELLDTVGLLDKQMKLLAAKEKEKNTLAANK